MIKMAEGVKKAVKGRCQVRILLLTAGSRGDVEPFVALGQRARERGHDVRLGVTREFVDQVRAAGLDVATLEGDFADLVAQQGVSAWAALRSYRTVVAPMMGAVLRSAVQAALALRPDIIVHHPKVLSAPVAATRLGVSHVLVEIVPTLTPTRAFPAAGVTTVDLGPLNPVTYRATAAASGMFAATLRAIRSELDLPARGPLPPPRLTLVPISTALLERPADWPKTTQITGAWHHAGVGPTAASELDDEVEAFLDRGEVMYAGFGSMAAGDPRARARAVIEAARATGRRVLLATGWGGLAAPEDLVTGDDVLVRRALPHTAVLPRCTVAVHHAGAGTAHAVVRAGTVSIPVPFLADQPFWAAQLHRRDLGTAPVLPRRLTTAALTNALESLPTPTAAARAAQAMAREDGCGTALGLLEQVAHAR